ncbi:MAG: YARHG domain-containing protein [Methylocella sp.]
MKARGTIAKLLAVASIASGGLASCLPAPAMAQNAASMSCSQLWYARNQIYARNGYCFETARARETFGAGCFPPYGKLDGWERDRVQELQMWERRKGC